MDIIILIAGDLYKIPDYIRQVGNQITGANCYKAAGRFNCSTFFGLLPYPGWLRPPGLSFNSGSEDRLSHHDTDDIIKYVWGGTSPRSTVCAPFYLGTLSPHLWKWHSMITGRKVMTDWSPESDYFVTLDVEEDSSYLVPGNRHLIQERNLPWINFIHGLQEGGFVLLLREKNFPDIGLTISIYQKTFTADTTAWNNLKLP